MAQNRNMYDCTACPRCKSFFRYPMPDGLIHCDDCGFVEVFDSFLKKKLAETYNGPKKKKHRARPNLLD